VDHASGPQEQQRFEESMRHQVKNPGGIRRYAARQEHVSKLRDG
jgi:hypothetical protein